MTNLQQATEKLEERIKSYNCISTKEAKELVLLLRAAAKEQERMEFALKTIAKTEGASVSNLRAVAEQVLNESEAEDGH